MLTIKELLKSLIVYLKRKINIKNYGKNNITWRTD